MLRIALILLLSNALGLTAQAAEPRTPAPTRLPHVADEMTSPGFWISRHPSPDRIIMTEENIDVFNQTIRGKQLTRDLFHPETFLSDWSAKSSFEASVRNLKSNNYDSDDGLKASDAFFSGALQNMNLHQTIQPEYGLIVRFADERLLPTDQGLYEEPGDVEFDQLQNNGLDIGTPVLVLHRSSDQKWVYQMNASSEGWIRADNVAVGDLSIVQNFASVKPFLVVTSAKADIYSDDQKNQWLGRVRMGRRLPVVSMEGSTAAVRLPIRKEAGKLDFITGYVNVDDIHQDYLPYTSRNVYEAAFRMMHQPYGWGDRNGEQDCSKFLQMIFNVFGIELPRNSKEQAKTGIATANFDDKTTDPQKREAFNALTDGVHLLTMKGHIMLFLGNVDGRAYAIHAVYAYREKTADGETARVINRVTVSDLEIGAGSKKGALLRRLTGIRTIGQ